MSSIKLDRIGEYVTIDAACKHLHIPASTLEYQLRRDDVPTYKLGHTRLVKLCDVQGASQEPTPLQD